MLKNNRDSKIQPWSRYYDPLLNLKSIVSERRVFKLVDRGEKGYSLPYVFQGYKNELDATSGSNKIIGSVKQYFDENLFRIEERKLLLSELMPSIEKFGLKGIDWLTARIKRIEEKEEIIRNTPEYSGHIELIPEYEKTIIALQQIREIIIMEFSKDISEEANIEPEVFISYSHDSEEHKDWVLQLATRLRSNGVNVILDRWNLKLGSNLAYFMERGLSDSHRVICICSESYVKKANGGIGGAGYEKQIIASELIKDQNTDWVIPLIKNNYRPKKTPTFLAGRLYIDFEKQHLYEKNYEELLRDLLDEPVLPIPPIGENPFQTIKHFEQQKFIPSDEKYVSPASKGTVTFDYSNNNGQYCIGQGSLMFELKFSKSSNRNIQLLNAPASIKTVAVVKGILEINLIKDAREYDGSSRVRRPSINQIAVLQNTNGFYAAIKISEIKYDGRNADCDEVTFDYQIQTNGSPDFSSIK